MAHPHKDVVLRVKVHCFDPGTIAGHPPASKTRQEIEEQIAKVNEARGCEIMTLLPAPRR